MRNLEETYTGKSKLLSTAMKVEIVSLLLMNPNIYVITSFEKLTALFFYSFRLLRKVSISTLQLSLLKSLKSNNFGGSGNYSFIFFNFSTNFFVFYLDLWKSYFSQKL